MRPTASLLLLVACLEYDPRGKNRDERVPNILEVPPEVVVDEIVQMSTPEVDVLWVIDNSLSMDSEQAALTANFPYFIDYFVGSGVDWHVGVTSTDLDRDYDGSQGKLRTSGAYKYIDPETPDPEAVFVDMASLGTSGSGNEKGLGATYAALETHRDTVNAGFYRDDASLHTIVISDEPDNTPSTIITHPEFVDWYDQLKPDSDQRTFSSIVDPATGSSYASVTDEIGGILWDITTEDWAEVLDLLGVQAAGLTREYFLSQLPVADTIVVEVVTAEDARPPIDREDWTYSPARNSITFVEYVPPDLSHVFITYHAAGGVVVDDVRGILD